MRRKQQLTYIFHNPNTEEKTIDMIIDFFADCLLEKALKLKEEIIKEMEINKEMV